LLSAAVLLGAAAIQAQTETVLHSFLPAPPDGANPFSGLIRDSAGNFYGTTSLGGTMDFGVVYKLDTKGHATVLHNFTSGTDGKVPTAGVVMDAAGNLYGTTPRGGSKNQGVVYKIDSARREKVLYTFTGGADGGAPTSGVILDSAGNLYGTTPNGGAGHGVVYKITPAGVESVLYTFQGMADGGIPKAGLISDAAGNLYGTTSAGGSGAGVVYKLNPGGIETVLYTFKGGSDGSAPEAGVILDSAGNLYGTTHGGGAAGFGVIYEISPAGAETVLYSFPGGFNGSSPTTGVLRDSAGNIYGTAGGGVDGWGVVYVVYTNGNEAVLHSFSGGSDGLFPYGFLIQDSNGNLYGTASQGGALTNACNSGCGIIYEVTPTAQETILYTFQVGTDGSSPLGGVVLDSAGNVYGTTSSGGGDVQAGTVFKVDPSGNETVLYTFAFGNDGAFPQSSLTLDSAGDLYGTTPEGGNNVCTGLNGCGTIFKIGASGGETRLYAFSGPDGSDPYSGVIFDPAGNLYGTTFYGGSSSNCPSSSGNFGSGCGVVYQLTAAGKEAVLYNFKGGKDGRNPAAGVVRDAAGNLYGATWYGGTGTCKTYSGIKGCGVIFKLDSSGKQTVLYDFTGGADGTYPNGVTLDANGNLYGTTTGGGNKTSTNCKRKGGCGVVFKLDISGTFTVLYTFTGGNDGGAPQAGVVLDAAGNLYGTAYGDGSAGGGVVFEVSPSGQETVLTTFSGPNGFHPWAPVALDSTGNLYGTTSSGGQQDAGVVFKIVLP